MISNRSRSAVIAALMVAGMTLLPALPALAAGARIARPVTDETPPAVDAGTTNPVQAPRARATLVTPVLNPMRETAPGEYEGIVPIRLPDGSWQVLLDERFHQFSVARWIDGAPLLRGCVHGASGLAGWSAAAPIALAPVRPAPGAVVPRVTSPTSSTLVNWEAK
jgi:hypothetical protein